MSEDNHPPPPSPTLEDFPASTENLRRLAHMGILKTPALTQALKLTGHIPKQEQWLKFLNLCLLVLGTGFLVSGIFFFFAFNWADMHRFVKLGLMQGAIIIAVSLAFWQGLDKLPGKIALSAASLLIGALLAVYGQVYQTGADAYSLFVTWTILMLGWVLIGQFTPLWLAWLGLLNLSLVLYWTQAIGEVNSQLALCLFLINGGSIVIWELLYQRGLSWLNSRWTPRLLAIPTFMVLVMPTIAFIFSSDYDRANDPWLVWMAGLFVITSVGVLLVYARKILDLFMLTLCAFSIIIVFNAGIIYLVDDEIAVTCLVSMFFVLLAGVTVTWLRLVAKRWEVEPHA